MRKSEKQGAPVDVVSDPGEGVSESPPKVDARLAAWMISAQPCAVARYLVPELEFPRPVASVPGVGPGWLERAVVDVLRACYAECMLDAVRERVDVVAMSVLPRPVSLYEEDDEPRRPFFFGPSPRARWERAVAEVSDAVTEVLSYGPTAPITCVGDVLDGGRYLRALKVGLSLTQRVDLLWRRPDGEIGAVIVVSDPHTARPPGRPTEDWRVILASAIVRERFQTLPEVHLVRVHSGVVQVARLSERLIENNLERLALAVSEARSSEATEGDYDYTYPLNARSASSLQRGDWPKPRFHPGGRPSDHGPLA